MVFAAPGAVVVELPLYPHVDRCFGYMAAALAHEYWVLPQIRCSYHGHYTVNASSLAALERLLRHVVASHPSIVEPQRKPRLALRLIPPALGPDDALRLFAAGQFAVALPLLRVLVDRNPHNATLAATLIDTHIALGDVASAAQTCNQTQFWTISDGARQLCMSLMRQHAFNEFEQRRCGHRMRSMASHVLQL